MHIFVLFKFNHEAGPIAVTGVHGDIADVLLPIVGDLVQHKDVNGLPFEGRVTHRIFHHDVEHGVGVEGAVSVTLCLERTVIH